jgi:hypothetical protein
VLPPENDVFTTFYVPKKLVSRDSHPEHWFHVVLHPEYVGFTLFTSREHSFLRGCASRKRWFYVVSSSKKWVLRDSPPQRWFYVVLHPEDVGFTWCYIPRTLVLRDFTSRRRWFYVTYLPKTLILRGFTSQNRLFYVGFLPEHVGASFTLFHVVLRHCTTSRKVVSCRSTSRKC